MKNYENNYEKCEFCDKSYFEYDTGYAEYACHLLGCECLAEYCPLSFKFSIVKEEQNA